MTTLGALSSKPSCFTLSLRRRTGMFLFVGLVVLAVGLFAYGVYFLFFKKNFDD
jgi:hypothetical protein